MGLHKTKEYVVRRELTFKPGDVFNVNAVNASFKKLYALKYFSDVKADPGPGTQPDTVDVTITVTEQKTSTLSFGAGYSTVNGIEGLVGVTDSDFGGNGQTVGVEYDTTSLNGSDFNVHVPRAVLDGQHDRVRFPGVQPDDDPDGLSVRRAVRRVPVHDVPAGRPGHVDASRSRTVRTAELAVRASSP